MTVKREGGASTAGEALAEASLSRLSDAAPAMLAALEAILDDGRYDNDGDFVLYHPGTATGEEDIR